MTTTTETETETRKSAMQAELDKWQAEVAHYDYEIQRNQVWKQNAALKRAGARIALAAYRREIGEIAE